MIELFGDWIMWDGERLAQLPANFPPGRRMLLEQHLSTLVEALDDTVVDLSGVDQWDIIHDVAAGRIYEAGEQHDNAPPLPDDHVRVKVVKVSDVEDALKIFNLTVECF